MYFEENVTLEDKKHINVTPCFCCLSTNRRLLFLGDNADVFCKLFENYYSVNICNILLCWECTAMLRKVKLFKEKVDQAQTLLSNHMFVCEINGPPDGLSNLTLSSIQTTHCFNTLHEFNKSDDEMQLDIKDETPDVYFEVEVQDINDEYHDEHNYDAKHRSNNFENLNINPIIQDRQIKKDKTDERKDETEKNITNNQNLVKKRERKGGVPLGFKRSLYGLDVNLVVKNTKGRNIQSITKNKNEALAIQDDDEEEKPLESIDNDDEDPDFKFSTMNSLSDNRNIKPKKILPYKHVYNKIGFTRIPVSVDEVVAWMEKDRKSDYFTKPIKSKFNCEICLKIIPNEKEKIKIHNKRHQIAQYLPSQFLCEYCKLPSRTQKSLSKHVVNFHNNIVACNDCSFKCSSESYMKIHILEHMISSPQCQHCNGLFKSKEEFYKHFCVCDGCDKRFKTKQQLEQHMIKSHIAQHCKLCNLWLKPGAYADHVTLKHTPEEAYCVACDVQFRHRKYYDRHVRDSLLHANERPVKVEKKTYPCKDCDRHFTTAQSMRYHHARVHLKQPIVRHDPVVHSECEICGKVYKKRKHLKEHMNVAHLGIREHPCDYCQRRFSSKHILENHIRTHTGERPFHCEHCDAKFAQKAAMRQHVKFIHMKARRKAAKTQGHILIQPLSST